MALHADAVFPTDVSYGSMTGVKTLTNIVVMDSGQEQRIIRWNQPRRRYDVGYDIRSWDELYKVYEHFIARQGPANTFPYKDWLDYSTAANGRDAPSSNDVSLGFGDGVKTEFQLIKRYASGSQSRTRNIRLPVEGTVLIEVNGVLMTEGVDFTVNYTSGKVKFNTPVAGTHEVKGGCEFYVEVRYESDDAMDISLDAFDDGSAPSIMVVEVLDGESTADDYHYGGSTTWDPVTADVQVEVENGRMLVFNTVSAGLAVYLPEKANLVGGGPYFVLANKDGTNSLSIRDRDTDAEVYVLTPGDVAQVWLSDEPNWYVI